MRLTPMVEVGSESNLWQKVDLYRCLGFREFFIAVCNTGEERGRYFIYDVHLKTTLAVSQDSGLRKSITYGLLPMQQDHDHSAASDGRNYSEGAFGVGVRPSC